MNAVDNRSTDKVKGHLGRGYPMADVTMRRPHLARWGTAQATTC